MASFPYNKEAEIVQAFNSTPTYLDDLLNIDTPYFEGKEDRIYPPHLMLNKASTSETHIWINAYLFLTDLFHPNLMISAITLILTY